LTRQSLRPRRGSHKRDQPDGPRGVGPGRRADRCVAFLQGELRAVLTADSAMKPGGVPVWLADVPRPPRL